MAKIDERKRSMASQRTPEQLKTVILKATQHLVAVGGMQNFSYPKLAAETGINAPTVYEHYKNKEALLTTCFLTIDNEIACKIANAPKSLSAGVKDLQSLDDLCWLLWLPYWNYLTADYDRTLFLLALLQFGVLHTDGRSAANAERKSVLGACAVGQWVITVF